MWGGDRGGHQVFDSFRRGLRHTSVPAHVRHGHRLSPTQTYLSPHEAQSRAPSHTLITGGANREDEEEWMEWVDWEADCTHRKEYLQHTSLYIVTNFLHLQFSQTHAHHQIAISAVSRDFRTLSHAPKTTCGTETSTASWGGELAVPTVLLSAHTNMHSQCTGGFVL